VGLLDNKYEIIKELGSGGFGKVFLAKDTLLKDRFVAIKILSETEPDVQKDLITEMELLSKLAHPSIVTFYHHFEQDNKLHLVMEYCSKGNLRERIFPGKKQNPDEICKYGIELAEVLEYVHSNGIIHHDIKPENLFVADGSKIKIGDFGVANKNLGTLSYMPPEYWTSDYISVRDPRSDVYSLAVTLLEMMTGTNPFYGKKGNELYESKVNRSCIPDDLPEWIQDILLKAMHPSPELRFQSMKDFKEALVSKSAPFLLDVNKVEADEYARKAEKFLLRRKWKEAKYAIDDSLRSNPDCIRGLLIAGKINVQMNRVKESQKFFEKARQLNQRAEVQKELGWIMLEEKRYAQAISLLSDHLHRYSSDTEALNLLIACYYETARYQQAADLCESGFRKNNCFFSNYILCKVMLGDEKVIGRLKDLWSDSNPFLDFNARVLLDGDTSWDKKKGFIEAKPKLLFQEHRFGIPKQLAKENELAVTIDGKIRYLNEKIISIGRSSTNTIVLNDKSISRRHCAIVNYNKDVWIYDLTSTVGTFLEGERIVGKRFLLGVYNVQVGNVQLRIGSQADLLI
jgi:tetratricopeptide (TPR) repeat protein